MARQEVKVKIELTPGYEKKYTAAVLQAYQRKANREGRTIGGAIYPQKRQQGQQ